MLSCDHDEVYRCSACGRCYPCKHKRHHDPKLKGADVARGWFWWCPSGKRHPAWNEQLMAQGESMCSKEIKRTDGI